MSVESLMILSESFNNNIRHKYTIELDGIDMSDFVFSRENLSVTDSLKSKGEDKFQPVKINMEFNFNNDVLNGSILELSKSTFLNTYVKDLEFSSVKLQSWLMNQSLEVQNLKVSEIFKLGTDIYIGGNINGMEYDIFSGVISEISFVKKNMSFDVSITAKSNLVKSYNKKFTKDEVLVDYYVSNSLLPTRSLLHRWATAMGYSAEKIIDVKYPDNSFIKIPFAEEKVDENIMQNFAELVRSFNGVLRVEDNEIIVNKYNGVVFPLNAVIGEKQIYQPFTVKEVSPDYKKVQVTFDQYSYGAEAYVWALKGENGTLNSANVLVPKNTPLAEQDLRWVIEWQPSGLVQEWKIEDVDVKAYKITGEQPPTEPEYVELEYELIDVSNNGGYIKFYNTKNYDIVIEKFKIKGYPVVKSSGNTFSFTKHEEGDISDSEVLEKSNKFVQSIPHAKYYSQLYYNSECENYTEVDFKHNHCLGYLKSGSNMFVRHNLLPDMEIIVTELRHNGNEGSITARTYEPFKYISNLGDTILNQGADDIELRTEEIANSGHMSTDKPSPPITFVVMAGINSIIVKLVAPQEEIIKGFNIYYRPAYQGFWNKIYTGNTTTVIYGVDKNVIYEIRATCVSYRELESDFTEIKTCQAKIIDSGDIQYPSGQSPEELEEARKALESVLNEAFELNERKFDKIEQDFTAEDGKLNSTITQKLVDFDADIVQKGFSSITQEVDKIEFRVEKAEGNISDLSDPTNLVSLINIAPEGVTIKGNVIKLNDGFQVNWDGSVDVRNLQADWIVAGNLDADKVSINNLRVDKIMGLDTAIDDKMATGNVTINANTHFYGDATIYSRGEDTDETTIIRGGSITFTKNGEPVTVIRNFHEDSYTADSKGTYVVSGFENWKNPIMLACLQSFSVSSEVRSVDCYSVKEAGNKFRLYLKSTITATSSTKTATNSTKNTINWTSNTVSCKYYEVKSARIVTGNKVYRVASDRDLDYVIIYPKARIQIFTNDAKSGRKEVYNQVHDLKLRYQKPYTYFYLDTTVSVSNSSVDLSSAATNSMQVVVTTIDNGYAQVRYSGKNPHNAYIGNIVASDVTAMSITYVYATEYESAASNVTGKLRCLVYEG